MTTLSSQRTRQRTTAQWCSAFVIAATLGITPAAWASHPGEIAEPTGDSEIVSSTDRLLTALRQLENLPPQARAGRHAMLIRIAAQRREQMLALMERNPRLAALRLFPTKLRDRLPAEARDLVEDDVEVAGHVHAKVIDDFAAGRSHMRFFLETDSGEFELHLADPKGTERDLLDLAGKRVSLMAARLNGRLLIRQKRDLKLQAGATSGSSSSLAAATTAAVSGQQRALVMLLNFEDQAIGCNATDLAPRLFGATGSTSNMSYVQSSRGDVSFTGEVVGPFTIPYSGTATSCDYNGWASAADAAARAAGIDMSLFNRHTYVVPNGGGCTWSGLGQTPGRRAWIRSCGSPGVYTHEWGHNLSFHHAGTPSAEYGDSSDPMGGARIVQFNGANRAMAGWLPEGNVQQVTAAGSYSLNALELSAASSPQVLRVYKTDTNEWYYISLRQAIDLDRNLSSSFINRLSVHRSSGRLPARTYLMATLPVGQTFTDSVNGITIAHQSLTGNVATVGVNFSGATCSQMAPNVTVAPTSQTAAPGGTATYTVSVTNLNTPACGTGTFALSQTLPSGFSGTLASSSLSIAPNASTSTTWSVTAGASMTDGTYTLGTSAVESMAGATPTSTQATFVVYTAPAPTLTVTRPVQNAVLTGSWVQLSATASDPSGIASVEFYVDNTRIARRTSSPYSVWWSLSGIAKGPHVIRVRAISRAGGTAESTINVTVN